MRSICRCRIAGGALVYFIPLVLLIGASGVAPVFSSFFHAVFEVSSEGVAWIGGEAFSRLLGDRALLFSFHITTLWAIAVTVIVLVWAVPVAALMYRRPALVPPMMVLLAILWIVPVFISAPIWRMFFHGNNGLSLFSGLFGVGVNLLTDPVKGFLAVLFATSIRDLPPVVFIVYAGMKKTPHALVDAARVEGAGEWQLFRFVHFSQVRAYLFLLVVVTTIGAFQEFTIPFLMTAGGPPLLEGITDSYVVGATTTLEIYLYDLFQFSGSLAVPAAYSSAFLVFFILTAGAWYLLRRRIHVRAVLAVTTAVLLLLFEMIAPGYSGGAGAGALIGAGLGAPAGIGTAAVVHVGPGVVGVALAGVLIASLRYTHLALAGAVGVVVYVLFGVTQESILLRFYPAVVPALGLLVYQLADDGSPLGRIPAGSFVSRCASWCMELLWRALRWIGTAVYAVGALLFLYLLIWISFSGVDSIFVDTVLPRFFGIGNYAALFSGNGFGRALVNSVILSAATAGVALVAAFAAAAATSMWRRDGRRIFITLQFFQISGGMHSLIPLFALIVLLGLVNSYAPIVVLYAASALPIGYFVLYGFMRELPGSLYDAARIAGASRSTYVTRILLPLSRPALVNVMLLAWISAWNGFLIPLIFLTDESRFPLSVFLHNLVGTIASGTPSWGAFSAGSVVNIVLLSFLFVASRRPFQYEALAEVE